MRKLLVLGVVALGVLMLLGALGRMFAPRWAFAPMAETRGGSRAEMLHEFGPPEGLRGEWREGRGERGFGPPEGLRGEWREGRGERGFARGHEGHGHGRPFFMPFLWWSGFVTKLALIGLIVALFLRSRQLRRQDPPPPAGPEAV
jgi:hypothetical protein